MSKETPLGHHNTATATPTSTGTNPGIRSVAIIGTGVIGASWASQFLAAGLDVIATDPAPEAERSLRAEVAKHWSILTRLGLASDASLDRLSFTSDIDDAVSEADLVQENGPERIDFKQHLFAQLDQLTTPETILASSSSGLGPTAISAKCSVAPDRVIVAHPFNPPHLIPLVEIVGGERASESTVKRAMSFYASIGKQPIEVKKELPGHIANRLQAALWREAYHLIEEEAVSVADLDLAISAGPGLRWALMGPLANQHLSGGEGGLRHVLEHLGPPMVAWWETLGHPKWTQALQDKLVAGVDSELCDIDQAAMVQDRDHLLEGLLTAKAIAPNLPENNRQDTTDE